MKEKKYPNGYLEKIKYWAKKYGQAVKDENVMEMDEALAKLTYFNDEHCEWLLCGKRENSYR